MITKSKPKESRERAVPPSVPAAPAAASSPPSPPAPAPTVDIDTAMATVIARQLAAADLRGETDAGSIAPTSSLPEPPARRIELWPESPEEGPPLAYGLAAPLPSAGVKVTREEIASVVITFLLENDDSWVEFVTSIRDRAAHLSRRCRDAAFDVQAVRRWPGEAEREAVRSEARALREARHFSDIFPLVTVDGPRQAPDVVVDLADQGDVAALKALALLTRRLVAVADRMLIARAAREDAARRARQRAEGTNGGPGALPSLPMRHLARWMVDRGVTATQATEAFVELGVRIGDRATWRRRLQATRDRERKQRQKEGARPV